MTSPDENLRHTETGTGDPVLLLDWTPWISPVLADKLSVRYRVISLEPPAGPGTTPTAEDIARSVIRIAESAGLDSYALVGVSLGADVAFRVALLRPESAATLVLVSPTCIEAQPTPTWDTPELACSLMLADPDNADRPPADPERTSLLSALAEQWHDGENDAANSLGCVSAATLVVFGQEDRLVSRRAGGVWKGAVPNCHICFVYDAGHAVGVDRPDALARLVPDFVQRREAFVVENRSGLILP